MQHLSNRKCGFFKVNNLFKIETKIQQIGQVVLAELCKMI